MAYGWTWAWAWAWAIPRTVHMQARLSVHRLRTRYNDGFKLRCACTSSHNQFAARFVFSLCFIYAVIFIFVLFRSFHLLCVPALVLLFCCCCYFHHNFVCMCVKFIFVFWFSVHSLIPFLSLCVSAKLYARIKSKHCDITCVKLIFLHVASHGEIHSTNLSQRTRYPSYILLTQNVDRWSG